MRTARSLTVSPYLVVSAMHAPHHVCPPAMHTPPATHASYHACPTMHAPCHARPPATPAPPCHTRPPVDRQTPVKT